MRSSYPPAVAIFCVLIAGCGPVDVSRSSELAVTQHVACHEINGKADHACNPGALNPIVTQDNIHQTICVPGWTKTVRPPVSYTNTEKDQERSAYGLTTGPDGDFEEDHIIPLELGGDTGYARGPRGLPANLYPEPWNGPTGAHAKDKEENLLHREMCKGTITLEQAQQTIIQDWVH